MNNFAYSKVQRIHDAFETLKQPAHSIIAGGTNLLDLMKYNVAKPSSLLDINRLEFHAIEERGNGLRLGALVSNAETAYHPLIIQRYPLLSNAILAGASAQIRNMATNGGNLLQRTRCYYFYDITMPCNKRDPGSGCSAVYGFNRNMAILGTSDNCIAVFPSDMCVALAALDATVQVQAEYGERSIPFHEFHRLPGDTPHIDNNLQPGEIIAAIDLPEKGFSTNYSYLKLRDRSSFAFALVSVATGMELEENRIKDIRIALGGIAHKPWRIREAEAELQDKEPTSENFSKAADIILDGAKGYRHNSFKIELAKRSIIRNGLMALNPYSQRPGAQPSLD